jgi:hypothetical protein
MFRRLPRTARRIAVLVLAVGAAVAVAGAAGSAQAAATGRVHAKQFFIGAVNGQVIRASIRMGCAGPVGGGRTGHPAPGQYVAAVHVHPELIRPGFTGRAATEIDVKLVLRAPLGPVAEYPVGVLTTYGVQVPIPVTLTLPCGAIGQAVFTPTPASHTARPYTVRVTLVGLP